MMRRTILEWETIRYGNASDEIPLPIADRIAAAASASSLSEGRGSNVFEQGRNGLRARGIVGVVATPDCAVEILPKIDVPGKTPAEAVGAIRHRLIHMLAVALEVKIDAGAVTPLGYQRESLLEILIRLFSQKLMDAVRHGMPRRYVECSEDLPVLRGGLDLTRQFTKFAAEPSRLACRFDALTPDTALNQIMKAAVDRLARATKTVGNQRRLRELAFDYADIKNVPVGALRWDQVVLDRTNQQWQELFNLARLLLGEKFQTTSGGADEGFSLLFNMSSLFEEYVARMLKRALSSSDLSVVTQGGRLYCLEAADGGIFQTRPDIIIKRGQEVVQLIDTKWKRIAREIDDAKRGVSQSDIYQMMAYGQLYKSEQLTLLYPHHTGLVTEEGLQSSHRVTGSKCTIEMATIDVANGAQVGERLKCIVLRKTSGVPLCN